MFHKKVVHISIVVVIAVSLSGCGCIGCLAGCGCLPGSGCFLPSKPNTVEDLHMALYREAEDLRSDGKYRKAVEKYERAFKLRPRRRKVININFLPTLKHHIAFCYSELAEAEGDISLYTKAEAAIIESYQMAMLQSDQAPILYLWGHILFKQARYEEALTKFETLTQRELHYHMMWNVLYELGKVYMALGDEVAARQTFAELLKPIETSLQRGHPIVEQDLLYRLGQAYMELEDAAAARRVFALIETRDYVRYDLLYRLGQAYMELEDETSAQRIFARLEAKIDDALQSGFPYIADELYLLGKAYMEKGDEAAARRTFTQLLEHYPKSSYKTEVKRLLQK